MFRNGLLALLVVAISAGFPVARALGPADLAVIFNEDDPLSVELAQAYVAARGIPEDNLIAVQLPVGKPWMGPQRFEAVYARVQAQTPPRVQAYVLTWAQPFRVGCMSISTAFAAGFDEDWCAKPCELTRRSPYFDSEATRPWDTFGLRPTMLLAALDMEQGRALIARGVAADGTRPDGVGYLVRTSDRHRNVRAEHFDDLVRKWRGRLTLRYERTDAVRGRDDVLFYFTGARDVPDIDSNRFLPGAAADHLTSGGGRLVGGPQMSVLRWLEAGATASYGTVVEPCAFPDKFPRPGVMLAHYYAGDTVLEAYWKSVARPGQGLFVGEPLARPFGGRSGAGGGRQTASPTSATIRPPAADGWTAHLISRDSSRAAPPPTAPRQHPEP